MVGVCLCRKWSGSDLMDASIDFLICIGVDDHLTATDHVVGDRASPGRYGG